MYILYTYLHTHVYRYYVAHQKPAPFKSYVRNMLFQGLLFTDIAPSKLPHLKSKSLRFLGRLVNAVATAAWYAKDLSKVCEAYQSYRLMLTLFETFWWKLICGEVIFWYILIYFEHVVKIMPLAQILLHWLRWTFTFQMHRSLTRPNAVLVGQQIVSYTFIYSAL